jgi:hypothetical protein
LGAAAGTEESVLQRDGDPPEDWADIAARTIVIIIAIINTSLYCQRFGVGWTCAGAAAGASSTGAAAFSALGLGAGLGTNPSVAIVKTTRLFLA